MMMFSVNGNVLCISAISEGFSNFRTFNKTVLVFVTQFC